MRGLLAARGRALRVDASRPYGLHPQVALRPEPFGALAYHYANRRLLFIRSPGLVALLRGLDEHASVAAALDAAGVDAGGRDRWERALGRMEAAEVILAR